MSDERVDPSRDATTPKGSGGEARDDDPGREQVESEGGEGSQNAEVTPSVADDGVDGQTQVDAPADDVGGARGQESRTD
jgi:hypothetical protein